MDSSWPRKEQMDQLVRLLDTHNFWTAEGAAQILEPFGVEPATAVSTFTDTSDQFKGLSIDGCEPGETAQGASSEDLADAIAAALKVETPLAHDFNGRGFRTRYIVYRIIDAVMKPAWVKDAEAAGYAVRLGTLDDPAFPTQGIWEERALEQRHGYLPLTLSDSGPDVRPFNGANAWVVVHPDEQGNNEFPDSWTDADVEAKKEVDARV